MPNWTHDQNLAINTFGGKVIVSAAAGSGKTAVLSERVLKLVLNKKSISKLLVVTFTNKAAEEMKERIKKKLEDEYLKDKNNTYLKNEILLIDNSDITTMDAFYSKLVKNNFNKLGIEKDFNILSNEEEVILKNNVIEKVFENCFIEVKDFERLLDFFDVKNSSLIKDVVFKISNFLDTISNKDEFYKKTLSYYEENNNYYKHNLFKIIKDKMNSYLSLYNEILDNLLDDEKLDKIRNIIENEKNYISKFLHVNSFDNLSCLLRSASFDRLIIPKDYKEESNLIKYKVVREEFKNDINKNLKEFEFITDDIYIDEQKNTLDNLKILFNVVKKYEEELFLRKNKINSYSFSDISRMCLNLLIKDGKKTTIAKALEDKYTEILIDEYQDTNNMQNVIFNAISEDGTNLFIVGDVKQSIYKFRSAKPEIFNNDKNNASIDSFPKLINLKKNFRSRKQVLDFCNFIFENTMTNSFGEVDYNDDEKLYLGANYKEGNNLNPEVIIIDNDKDDNEEKEDDLSSTQKEAIVVADKIRCLLDSKHKIYDNKLDDFRDIRPNDIVILLRSLSNSDVFKEALNKRKISVYMENSNDYIDNYEIKLVINILKVIDNLYDDVALVSVLSSNIFNISYNTLASIKSNDKNLSMYDAINTYGNKDTIDVINELKKLKDESYNISIVNLLSKIYKKYSLIAVLSAFKGGVKRQKNLEVMLKHASSFDNKESSSLHKFITYLEDVILNKTTLEGVNPLSEGQNVLITTIHKSKGLEYPVVIVAEAGKKFNFKDTICDYAINEDLGFVTNIKDSNYKLKYESIPMFIYKTYEKNKMISEELRILYVALTRAKEKIIVTGSINNIEKKITNIASKIGNDKNIYNFYMQNIHTYLDIIIPCLLRHKDGDALRSLSLVKTNIKSDTSNININLLKGSLIDEKEFNKKDELGKQEFDIEDYKDVLEYKYDSNLIPKYLSVSDIKKKDNYLRNPNFLTDNINHTNLGILYHMIFEKLPVKKYTIFTLEEELNKFLTKEELKMVKIEKIFSYLTSNIYDELIISDKYCKEFKVNFKIPSNFYDKSLKSGNILVSGVIDLLYIKNDIYNIVDYKTDNVDNMDELKDLYKVQLDLYEIALKQKYNAKKVKKYIYSIKLAKFIEV